MAGHPDLEAEQAYIDHAYACLEASREAAVRMSSMVEVGRGGTNQARYERDVIWETMANRLAQLELGNAALCFGRIDFEPDDLEIAPIAPTAPPAPTAPTVVPPSPPTNGDGLAPLRVDRPTATGVHANGSRPPATITGRRSDDRTTADRAADDPERSTSLDHDRRVGAHRVGAPHAELAPPPADAHDDGGVLELFPRDGSTAAPSFVEDHDVQPVEGSGVLDDILDIPDDLAVPGPVPAPVSAPDDNSFYIGRVAVSDDEQNVIVVDWRAPIAEPFYRATGREPMGLARRRHFATRGRTLLGIEDELFGDALASIGTDGEGNRSAIRGHGALIAALETTRTGRMSDIVATIQGEQDEIIRAEMPGLLVVQGGPGTGKTVVALHRAAYLLYTFRFPLEGQGVLVVGPNRLFLGYIEQVLPSLGEAGIEMAVLADLVPDVEIQGFDTGSTARVKGDLRMATFLGRAVRDRQMSLRDDLVVGYGLQHLRITVGQSRHIVDQARRRYRNHNAGRKFVESEVYAALARSGRDDLETSEVRERVRHHPDVRLALERMWPVLTPAQLLHDLYGAPSLLRHAATGLLTDDEWRALHRRRSDDVDAVRWTNDDGPLLDEVFAILGPLPRTKRQRARAAEAGVPILDEVRTYGHIVVDEAQDLSPMQLRMLNRRSLNGSMTIVGDIAQSTGQWAHDSWQEVLDHLPAKRPTRRAELTIGYRLPAPNMALAARVLRFAAPDLSPPSSIRGDGDPPRILGTPPGRSIGDVVVDAVRVELDAVGLGNIAVIVPWSLVDTVDDALTAAGIDHGRATRHGLDEQVTVVPVGLVKGLELDASVVVEPAAIVDEEPQGLRSLYVALTRATKRLALVHQRPLPVELSE